MGLALMITTARRPKAAAHRGFMPTFIPVATTRYLLPSDAPAPCIDVRASGGPRKGTTERGVWTREGRRAGVEKRRMVEGDGLVDLPSRAAAKTVAVRAMRRVGQREGRERSAAHAEAGKIV